MGDNILNHACLVVSADIESIPSTVRKTATLVKTLGLLNKPPCKYCLISPGPVCETLSHQLISSNVLELCVEHLSQSLPFLEGRQHQQQQLGATARHSLREVKRLLQWSRKTCFHTKSHSRRVEPEPGGGSDGISKAWQSRCNLFVSETSTHCSMWFSKTETTSPLGQEVHPLG